MIRKLFLFIIALALVASVGLAASVVFLKPFLKEKLLEAAKKSNFADEIAVSELDIGLLRGIISIKGIELTNPVFKEYNSSAVAGGVTLDIDLPWTILQRDLVFQKVVIENLTFRLNNKKKPSVPVKNTPMPRGIPDTCADPIDELYDELYVKSIVIKNSKFIFEDHHITPPPNIIELNDIDGKIDGFYASLRGDSAFNGTVHLDGLLNSRREGRLKVDGTFAKNNGAVDFDLELDLGRADLINFSPYYSQTSLTILKEAKVDLRSKASCQKDRLDANQQARIYDISLEEMELTDEDRLFGLPAKTVMKFFKDSKGEVEFDFDIVGTIKDPRFSYGPVIEDVLAKALREKIMARLRDLPREVIKMGEKALKENLK